MILLVSHFVLYSRRCHGRLRCHFGDPLGVPADDGVPRTIPFDRHVQATRVTAELSC